MGVKASSYSDRHPGGDASNRRARGRHASATGGSKSGWTARRRWRGGDAAAGGHHDSGGAAGAAASSAPGVTSNSITVGTISTQTGPISSNFSSLIYGEKAYFDYINARAA
jgi:hypothetical protein